MLPTQSNQTNAAKQTKTEDEQLLPPVWSASVVNLPVDLKIDDVILAEKIWEGAMEPCTLEEAAVMLAKLVDHFGAPENWDDLTDDYIEALEDLPLDILTRTYKNIIRSCKWFPKIAEIRNCVPQEMIKRTITAKRITHIRKELERRA